MYSMFVQLKKMYEYELYANVLPIGSILLTAYGHDRSILTAEQYFLTLMYYGNSLYNERLYRKAEEVYRMALQARKAFHKLKSTFPTSHETVADQYSDIEIRYKIALCLEVMKQISEASAVLQAIPSKQRSPKVNMLLAKLLLHNGYDKSAALPLKAVLKECPLNLAAIKSLLPLGIKQMEINSIVGDSDLSPQCSDWLQNYIAAYTSMYMCKFAAAIEHLKSIESKLDIGDNEVFQVLIGQCFHYLGNHDIALSYLQRAHNNTTYLTDGLMTLASLYAIKNRLESLEKLTQPLYQTSEYTAENWFVLAQHLYSQGKYDKASFFAQKSCYLKPKNIEAILLKAKIFMQLKKYKEAILNLRILEQFASYRFEVYEGLVDAYIATHRLREAQEISRVAVRRQGPLISPRSLVLLAKPYFHHDERLDKIKSKSLITQALSRDEYYLPAVYMLVDILQEEGDTVTAKKLIKKQLAVQPNSKLYSMLGDLQSHEKDLTKAVENYTIAINMDPTNRKAVAGLMAMGQSMGSGTKTEGDGYSAQSPGEDGTEYQENAFEMVELPAPVTAEAESESDAVWSDVEIDVTNA